jgi:hypothetical protein
MSRLLVALSQQISPFLCIASVAGSLLTFSLNGAEKQGDKKSAPAPVEVPFRPEVGKFPPIEKALAYRGEIVFIDHANRRGSIRVQGEGTYFRNPPHPFALLPYGMVRYHGAPADLRDIPLGTVMHALAYLPPDPATSSVPVLPVDQRNKTSGYSGKGITPAENHVALLEDEPSHCLRNGLVWKLQDIDVKNREAMITASREPRAGGDTSAAREKLTLDATTRVWRGRERVGIDEMISEGAWPAEGKKALEGQNVLLGISWIPTPDGIFTRFHISDIWLDEPSMEHAAKHQSERHKASIRKRWMPAWVDAVDYGKFGRATITATLFGGMDAALYADFEKGVQATMNAVEDTLKHAGGAYGPAHMSSRGTVLEVIPSKGEVPFCSSGIQIRFETDLIIEGVRPGRVVRVRPASWPLVNVPREEYIGDSNAPEDRFPAPTLFPKY